MFKSLCNRKVNVLVTGVGAIIGYGIIKSLRKSNLECYVIGMDIYSDAVGQNWCDEFIQAEYAVSENYIDFLKAVIDKYEVDIVFFGTEQEIYKCAFSRDSLGKYYNKLVLNRSSLLAMTNDKWHTYCALLEHGLCKYAIPSSINGSWKDITEKYGNEILLKPRKSYASKGIHRVSSLEDFEFYRKKMGDNFMVQPIIGDDEHEYTVGVFGLGDGNFSDMIQMKRKLSQEGATAKAIIVNDDQIGNAVKLMCEAFCPIGPTNFQFRKKDDKVYLLEINPRISSSTSIRMEFGFNEALKCINFFLFNKIEKSVIKRGYATRFIDEVVVCE